MDIPVREWLWPNLTTFITTLLVLIFSYYLFKKHLFEPTRKFLKKREDFISKNIQNSVSQKEQAQSILQDAQSHFDKTISDSSNYLDKQMNLANKKAQKLVDNTKSEMQALRKSTQESLHNAQKEARQNLKNEVATLSLVAASKILEKEIDDKDSKKLIDEFIKEIK